MNQVTIKVGLVGMGNMGQNHLRILSLLKGVEVVFIYDQDGERAARFAAQYGVSAVADADVAMATVDAVVIATPTSTHHDWIKRAANHVKHIFVEKPIASTLAEAEDIAKFAAVMGLNIQTGFIERFNPAVQVLKRILDRSERVIGVDFTRTNKLSARIKDVDVITDLMIHDIDLALYLNGSVRSVSAHGTKEGSMIDYASALLTHENGRFSRIQASRITDKKMRKIEATCRDMFVDCELLRKEVQIFRHTELRQREGEPYVISGISESLEVRPQEALLSELQSFAAWVSSGVATDSAPNHLAGLDAMRICDQIQSAVLA